MSFDEISRRGALKGLAGVGAASGLASCSDSLPFQQPLPVPPGPFKHGVASGDPDQTSVVIWTAVTEGTSDQPVEFEFASDAGFSNMIDSGRVVRSGMAAGTSVPYKLLISNLQPGREYFFRFRHAGEMSPVGRTKTLPSGSVSQFNIAAFACSNYPAGYFNAYRAAAERGGIDLVLHLGDYIYEYGMGVYATEDAERLSRIPQPAHELLTEADYALRHSQYSLDPDLQAIKAVAPMIAIWDDHETANDAYADGAENHQPGEGNWIARRNAALSAWYAWMPAREPNTPEERYGAVQIGNLGTLIYWETRLMARSQRIDWTTFPVEASADPDDPQVQAAVENWLDNVVGDPSREMLGERQMDFVRQALTDSVNQNQPWRIIANQVIMGRTLAPDYPSQLPFLLKTVMRMRGGEIWEYALRTRHGIPMTTDDWDGFPAERERVYAAARRVGADFVVLTGDTHNSWCLDLHDETGQRRGTEFGVTAVSSPSEFEYVDAPGLDFGQMTEDRNVEVLRHNAYDKGYLWMTLTPEVADVELVTVSTVKSRSFETAIDSRWRVQPANGGTVPQVVRVE